MRGGILPAERSGLLGVEGRRTACGWPIPRDGCVLEPGIPTRVNAYGVVLSTVFTESGPRLTSDFVTTEKP